MDTAKHILRALVVGLTGKQAAALRHALGHEIDLRILTPERALRLRASAPDVVITTRFIGHKHERHLRRVCGCPVICLHSGCAQAVADELRSMAISMAKAA